MKVLHSPKYYYLDQVLSMHNQKRKQLVSAATEGHILPRDKKGYLEPMIWLANCVIRKKYMEK